MNSYEGHLLIAAPHMSDPRFHRAVILVLHHDEHGAMGVVLNQPISQKASAIASLLGEAMPGPLPKTDGNFHVGGPVAGPLIVLQGLPRRWSGSRHALNYSEDDEPGRVFVVEEQDQLQSLIDSTNASLQFYVGHAGWQEGQLEDEVADGSWLTLQASAEFVFGDDEDMWMIAMRDFGQSFYREVLGIDQFPEDSTAN